MRFYKENIISGITNGSSKTISLENKYKKRSLQAQALLFFIQKMREAHSLISSTFGSITVETSLAIPIFLCMLCSLLSMGQFFLLEADIQYATAQTAREVAIAQAVAMKGDQAGSPNLTSFLGTVNTYAYFYEVYHADGLSTHLIRGGKYGIDVRLDSGASQSGLITVTSTYHLKVPFAHYFHLGVDKKASVTTRIFSGFEEHGSLGDENDPVVYVAAFGGVYHTSLSCSHITRKISGDQIGSLKKSKYQPCSKCMKNGDTSGGVYVSAHGKHYHSSLTCSDLKRTVRAVRKSELGNMRVCEKCASGGH